MEDATRLVRHKVDFSNTRPIVTPIFQTSAFHSGDPYFYTRNSNPNFVEVEEILAKIDNAAHGLIYSAGMAAVAAVLHLLSPGQRLLVNELIYGCSYRFIYDHCKHFGVEVRFVDLVDSITVEREINGDVAMVLFETPTNPFLKTVNIQEVSRRLHSANPSGIIVVDNTWATSLFQKPLELGADVALYSNSKFNTGHSDAITGAITTDSEVIYKRLFGYRFYHGAQPDPFAVWLLRRSLQTLHVRMARHAESTREIIQFLTEHPIISEVMAPEIDGVQLVDYGGLLFVRLAATHHDAVRTFMNTLRMFDHGTSMASVASAVANPYFGSHLSMTTEEKECIGLDEFLVRLSIGLESTQDLKRDLDVALLAAREVEHCRSGMDQIKS